MGAGHRTSDDAEGRVAIPSGDGPVQNREVTWMEHRGNEARERTEDDGRKQDPGRLGVDSNDPRPVEDHRFPRVEASRSTGTQGLTPKREVAS